MNTPRHKFKLTWRILALTMTGLASWPPQLAWHAWPWWPEVSSGHNRSNLKYINIFFIFFPIWWPLKLFYLFLGSHWWYICPVLTGLTNPFHWRLCCSAASWPCSQRESCHFPGAWKGKMATGDGGPLAEPQWRRILHFGWQLLSMCLYEYEA